MNQLATIDGSTLRLSFHPGQSAAWNSERRFVFMLAGTQSGKTSFCPHWLNREITRCGGGDHIAATSTFDLFKLKFLPTMRELFEHQLGIGRYWAADRIIELKDPDTGVYGQDVNQAPWGRIILRSAQAPGGLESATARSAVLDECGQDEFKVDAWEAVLRRLSLSQGRVLGTTTLYNLGWLKTQIWDKWAKGDKSIDVISFASIINPLFPREEFERARESLPPWKFNMFYLGKYDRPAGLIYDVFDPARHVIEPFAIPYDWPRYIGLDFGGVNTAAVKLAKVEDGGDVERYVLYSEYLAGSLTAAGHVRALRDPGVKEPQAYGGSGSEGQWRSEFTAAGLRVYRPPVSDVEVGIDRVYKLLATDRLKIFSDCTGVIDQLGSYSRPTDEEGNVMEGIMNKEIYHYLDALRYIGSRLSTGSEATAGAGNYAELSFSKNKQRRKRAG